MMEISIYSEFITLGQFLKLINVISSGGEARYFLDTNDVFVNEINEKRRGKKLFPGDFVVVLGKKYHIVSR